MKVTYKEFASQSPLAGKVISEEAFEYMRGSSDHTGEFLGEQWERNIRRNLQTLYAKCGSVKQLVGFGASKATIGVGAGPSYHINKNVLKDVFRLNAKYDLDEQAFIIVCTNHQFPQLLKDGIFPHFVMLLDATEKVGKQLLKAPKLGKDSILISSLYACPEVLEKWVELGRELLFYLPDDEKSREIFLDITKEDPEDTIIPPAGNVMNMLWFLTARFFHSMVFMCTGNDLSFEHSFNAEERKKAFYADGKTEADDERKQFERQMGWMGFKFGDDNVFTRKPVINLEFVDTSKQLFIYKLWMEMHFATWQFDDDFNYKFYNCSESGILGVLAKQWDIESFYDKDNWYLMDDICKNWKTMRLKDAVTLYLEVRRWLETQMATHTGAGNVIISPAGTGGAGIIVPPTHGRIIV